MTPRVRWQLPASYFAFFLPAGALLSYLPAYLSQKGLPASQIGLVFSSVFAVKLVMGPLMAWWADAGKRQLLVLFLLACLNVASTIVLGAADGFFALFFSVICISLCRNYFQSTLEGVATSVKSAGGNPRYGWMRAVGSLSVCAGVLLFGGVWAASSSYQQVILPTMILLSGAVLVICTVSAGSGKALVVQPPTAGEHPASGGTPFPLVLLLLGSSTLLVGANGVFYSTGTVLLQREGFGPREIASLWLVAFGIEAAGFALYDSIRARLGEGMFFAVIVVLACLRWTLFSTSSRSAWLMLAFALHVASFSWMHAYCANWVRETVSPKFATTGQAVYVAFAHGIGMALSSYFAASLFPTAGTSVFTIALFMTAAGGVLGALYMAFVKHWEPLRMATP